VNANGIKIYINKNNNWIEEYYSTSILKMSGCGACSLPDNIYVYGDLSGNITIFDKNKEKYEQIPLDKEMVRSICSDKNNKIIYIGNISGKIFYYNYNNKALLELKMNISNNNETITCLRYLHPNLYFSDTGGNVFIFNTKENKIIYNYLPHEPQKDNTNIEFGSLSIKSEVWSFFVHEIDDENAYIITGSEDQSIKIWRIKMNKEKNFIKKNKLIKVIKEHKYAVTCLDWSSIKYDDSYKEVLLSCSDDKTINIFDCSEEKFNILLKVDFSKCIWGFFTLTYCSFNHCNEISSESNNLLCVGAQAGYIIIYDIKDKKIKFLEKIHYGGIEGLVFENNIISTCGNDNTFNIIEINDV
jgi:WD40 repeat protein